MEMCLLLDFTIMLLTHTDVPARPAHVRRSTSTFLKWNDLKVISSEVVEHQSVLHNLLLTMAYLCFE